MPGEKLTFYWVFSVFPLRYLPVFTGINFPNGRAVNTPRVKTRLAFSDETHDKNWNPG
jgi:hypothetical protein